MSQQHLLAEMIRLLDAGLPLLPNHPLKKYPAGHKGWEKAGYDEAFLTEHICRGGALGLRMGNGRETLDLDSKHWLGNPAELREGFEMMVEEHAPGLLARLVIARTPSDSRHYIYNCPEVVEGNKKLAERRPTKEELVVEPRQTAVTLIETRGEGGQIMIAPSPGYELIQGDLTSLPTITVAERTILHACARAWSEVAPNTVTGLRKSADSRPGEFCNSNDGSDEALKLLAARGWAVVKECGSTLYLRRPGKTEGISATYGYIEHGVFYCFTSNGAPFEPNTAYTPFAVYALLVHDGDFRAAAKELAERHGMPYYPEGEPVERHDALCCPRHTARPLRASDRTDWVYCSAKVGDGYCTYSARIPNYVPPVPEQVPSVLPQTSIDAEGPTAALAAALEIGGYRCVLNTETDEISINGELLNDVTYALLRAEVRDRALGKVSILDDAIILQAHRNRVAPIRDGLAALEWDGRPHISKLAACLHTADGDVIRYNNGATRRAAEVFLLRWLLGAVGRVLNGEQNAMLVLDGDQDLGKSSFAKWLGSVLLGTFCEETINPQEKDSLLRLTRILVWEAPEIDAVTRRHDAAALKHFLTRSTVQVRRAYGRYDTVKPVRASFIGTVNSNGAGFLPDSTGNRRYLVLTLTNLDWTYQHLDVRQVWAEAVARYRQGERGKLTLEEASYRDMTNSDRHQQGSLMDDWLRMHFTITGSADDLLTSGEIAEHLARHRITLNSTDRGAEMAIANALTRAGIRRADRRRAMAHYGDSRRAWVGICLRLCSICDPTSEADPTLIRPRAMVGSRQQYAANTRLDPTDPTFTKKGESGTGGGEVYTPAPLRVAETLSGKDSAREVGTEEALRALESLDPPFLQVGSRLDQGWISNNEDGSSLLPPGWRLVRCDHKGNRSANYGAQYYAEGPNGERTDPCESEVDAAIWARIAAGQDRTAK